MKTSAVGETDPVKTDAMEADLLAVGLAAQAPAFTKPPRRLKIAVLNRIFSPTGGGAERYSIALVEQLAAVHEVHVFAQEIHHQWPGVHYHRIAAAFKKPRWLNQLWYASATWQATRHGFDIVHSHENVWHGNVHTMHVKTVQRSLFEGLKGLPLALRRLKVALSPRLLTYLGFERVRLGARQGVAVVAASQLLQAELLAQYPRVAGRISTITPGVAMPHRLTAQTDARRALGVVTDGPCIAFIANDYARKGLPTLLAAAQGLPGVHLLVAGHPGQIARFKTQAHTLGIAQRVHFLGPQADIGVVYCAANLLAHPTLEDTFAMVVLEAMAHGLPVVVSASPYCGIAALLTDGENALLLSNPQDPQALQTALQSILGNPSVHQRLSKAGYSFAQQHSWQAAALQYQAVYYSLGT
jgi:UDP-glucose:(heptosyl)LPS alpha-1,3-glucosyltransferase